MGTDSLYRAHLCRYSPVYGASETSCSIRYKRINIMQVRFFSGDDDR